MSAYRASEISEVATDGFRYIVSDDERREVIAALSDV